MKKTSAVLITLFFGIFGVHRFMAGKIPTGIIWLCTGGFFVFGWIFDLLKVMGGTFRDKYGNPWGVL